MLSKTTVRNRFAPGALVILGAVFVVIGSVIVAYPALFPSGAVTLAAGQVAPADILAPRSITYESEALTTLSRQAAADAIRDVYDPPNPGVLRQQIQLARNILDYIENIRHDSYAKSGQQVTDLLAISGITLNEDLCLRLLALPDDVWKNVDEQVMSILERTMRDEVREGNLKQIYDNLPNRVSFVVSEAQAALIVTLVKDLIKPNTFFNEERTRAARQHASEAVPAETRSFARGQIVVRAGAIVTPADMEALTQFKLLQPPDRRGQVILGAVLAVLLVALLAGIYMRRFHTDLLINMPHVGLLCGLFLIFLAGSRIFSLSNEFQSYLYPAAALSLLIVALAGAQVAIASSLALAVLVGVMTGNSLEFATMIAIGGTAGALSLVRVERLNAYFTAGLTVSLVNVTIGLLFMLTQGTVEPLKIATIVTAGLLNGVLSAGLAVVGLYLFSTILNMPTSVRLIDLTQPNQPLLQRLLREAPGTYQHSLQVANLAELAAERIGANALLTRAMALYHDIGKVIYPHFFIENQIEGENPHDALDNPQRSAAIIIGHVSEGEKLARHARLPTALIEGITEHHGTLPVLYFYHKAMQAANSEGVTVDRAAFSYAGPIPQTRESALLMLADASESVTRARRPHNRQEIEAIIAEVIDMRIAEGQLDDSHLTVSELKIIAEVYVTTLLGVFHPRINYPAPVPTPGVVELPVPDALEPPSSPAHALSSGEVVL
jgi:putative nucleotidyltransferase with HDIG domain